MARAGPGVAPAAARVAQLGGLGQREEAAWLKKFARALLVGSWGLEGEGFWRMTSLPTWRRKLVRVATSATGGVAAAFTTRGRAESRSRLARPTVAWLSRLARPWWAPRKGRPRAFLR